MLIIASVIYNNILYVVLVKRGYSPVKKIAGRIVERYDGSYVIILHVSTRLHRRHM